jgi:hypothetical protein
MLKETNKVFSPKCPFLSCIGQNYVSCTLHAINKDKKKFDTENCLRKYLDEICYKNFNRCETYLKIYVEEIKSQDKYIKQYHSCTYCCNSTGYTGLKEHSGQTHTFCQVFKKEIERPGVPCEWFNCRKVEKITNMFNMLKDPKNIEIGW